jgi:chromosome segregation ATPase
LRRLNGPGFAAGYVRAEKGIAVAEPAAEPGEWLTLSEAASRLGWHLQRVQSRARREEWPKRKANKGQALEYLVPSLLLVDPAAPEAVPDAAEDVATASLVAELREEIAELRAKAARAEGELVAELRRSQDIAAALAKSEARTERLEAELADVRKRAEAELADARKPALLRLLEALRRR